MGKRKLPPGDVFTHLLPPPLTLPHPGETPEEMAGLMGPEVNEALVAVLGDKSPTVATMNPGPYADATPTSPVHTEENMPEDIQEETNAASTKLTLQLHTLRDGHGWKLFWAVRDGRQIGPVIGRYLTRAEAMDAMSAILTPYFEVYRFGVLPPIKKTEAKVKIHLRKDANGWRLVWVAKNGKQVALTGDGYTTRAKALHAARTVGAAYYKAFQDGLLDLPLSMDKEDTK